MPKKNHKLNSFFKIKIHNNRWLIWAIAYVVFVAIAVLGYINISISNIDSDIVADNQFQPWRIYKNSDLGFSQRYPSDWWLEKLDKSSVGFVPRGSDQALTIQVIKPSAETAIRKTLKIRDESRTTLDDNPAAKITNNLGNNHFETVILSIHNHRLYVMRGSQSFVQKFQLTFNFE